MKRVEWRWSTESARWQTGKGWEATKRPATLYADGNEYQKMHGFGACFNGDDVYKSTDGSYCTITDGNDHQQVTAPGYTMYYVWMIRHIDGDPWYKTTRFYAEEHEWLTRAD